MIMNRGDEMVEEKSVEEFRNSGLLWLANNLLHVFGWAIVIEYSIEEEPRLYPARVKFRGFDGRYNDAGYKKVSQYMKDNAETLLSEIDT